MVTTAFGVVGLAVSVGVVCDGRVNVAESVQFVHTRGTGVFWPPEHYYSVHALPDVWVGSMASSQLRQHTAGTVGTRSVTGPPDSPGGTVQAHAAAPSTPKSHTTQGTNYSDEDFGDDMSHASAAVGGTREHDPSAVGDSAGVEGEAGPGGHLMSQSSVEEDDVPPTPFEAPPEPAWALSIKQAFLRLAGPYGCNSVVARDVVRVVLVLSGVRAAISEARVSLRWLRCTTSSSRGWRRNASRRASAQY